jgi:AraC-like DNA-binding protein
MDDEPVAYHLVVRAMEDRAGMDAGTRFALAIRHAVAGHLPHPRYREAAISRRRAGAGSDSVERSIADWMSTDLNPLVRSLGSLRSHANAIWAYNAYNRHASLGVRTSVESAGPEGGAARVARRESRVALADPELCAVGTVSALDKVLRIATRNQARGDATAPGILQVGRLLGVEASAAFHVAEAMAGRDRVDLDGVARHLGASRRALQRRLAEESTSFEAIRGASRMTAATDALRSDAPLAEVAWRCGFSDLPHMSRAMKAACGMTPGLLRAILLGGAEPESSLVPEGYPR